MILKPATHRLTHARMRLGVFARAVGLDAARMSQLRAEGAIVGEPLGRGFLVDVPATIQRSGRPDWVWAGEDVEPAPFAALPSPPSPPSPLEPDDLDAPPPEGQPRRATPPAQVAAPPEPPPAAQPPPEPGAATPADYYSARARRELANAALAEVRLAEARRTLLPAHAVRDYCGQASVSIRERLLALEPLSATHLDAVAQVWLATELRRALGDCADTLDRAAAQLLSDADIEARAVTAAAPIDDEADDAA